MSIEHHGNRWFAYHHASSEEHKQYWKDRVQQGWYCISLSRANTVDDPWFSAVWIGPPSPLPKQTESHVGWDGIVDYLRTLPEGTIPTIITSCGKRSEEPRFTVVTEPGTQASFAVAALSEGDFLTQCKTSRTNGKILRWAAANPRADEMRYVAIFVANATRVAWKCTGAMTSDDFQAEFEAQAAGWWVRPSVMIPTLKSTSNPSSQRFMAGWTDGVVISYVAHHGVDGAHVGELIKKYKEQGLLPTQIQSLGVGSDTQYALLFGSPDDVIQRGPSTRYLGVTRKFSRHADSYSLSPAMTTALDAAVKKDMQNTGHRAAALAVAYNGDLVFAAGLHVRGGRALSVDDTDGRVPRGQPFQGDHRDLGAPAREGELAARRARRRRGRLHLHKSGREEDPHPALGRPYGWDPQERGRPR